MCTWLAGSVLNVGCWSINGCKHLRLPIRVDRTSLYYGHVVGNDDSKWTKRRQLRTFFPEWIFLFTSFYGEEFSMVKVSFSFLLQASAKLAHHNPNHKPQTTINHGALANSSHPSAARMQLVRLLHRRMAALSIAHRLMNTPTATIGTRCPVSGSKEPAEQRCICCFRWHINAPILM